MENRKPLSRAFRLSLACLSLLTFLLSGNENAFAGSSERLFKTSCGRVLSYEMLGKPGGKPVFYLHGLLGSRKEATLMHDKAKRAGICLIAFDRPGVGKSTFYADREILDLPRVVVEMANKLYGRRSKFGIFAYSGGAPYGCACALKIPHRISHFALVSGLAPGQAKTIPGNSNLTLVMGANLPKLTINTLDKRAALICDAPDKALKKYASIWSEADRELVFSHPGAKKDMLDLISVSMAQGGEALQKEISLQQFYWGFDVCEIKGVEVSIWNGGSDPVVTPSMGKYFHRHIEGSTFHLLPDEGHATLVINNAVRILKQF